MKRVALVGVTGYGGVHFRHLKALAEAGECDLGAAAVVNPEHPDAAAPLAWLRERGAAVYPAAEALFRAEKNRLDLVCLPVGIAAHEPLVRAALDALNGWDPTGGCLYDYNPKATQDKWIRTRTVKTVIGNHSFAV